MCTAVASFPRALDIILGNDVKSFCLNYLDDILIVSSTWEQHLEHISIVLERLHRAGVTIKLAKSKFGTSRLKFLGHEFTNLGIRITDATKQAIMNFPIPINKKALQSFLGLCNWERRFTKEFAQHSFYLQKLLKKGVKFVWSQEQQNAFESLKKVLCESALLYHPKLNEPFILESDVSGHGIGARLYQLDEQDVEHDIAFASRTLKGAEINYSTTEKEALAVVYAVQKWQLYLLGARVIIKTDHKALEFLMTCKLTNSRLTRWSLLVLQQFDLTIKYIPGIENKVADSLSRHPCPTNSYLLYGGE